MHEIVKRYYSGVSVTELTREYGINHWSVKKLVRERGHKFHQDNPDDTTAAP